MVNPIIDAAIITEHLRSRPIAAIFDKCDEKQDYKALQFMSIVDYEAERRKLYERIGESPYPKLLSQLLQFCHFGRFRFYDFHADRRMKEYVLQCKFCELTGPYACILTHMAINHNVHTALKTCTFCNKEDVGKHLDDHSLDRCHHEYVQRYRIVIDESLCDIVSDFYAMLKDISVKLDIITIRNKNYCARGYGTVERLDQNYDEDFSNECTVFRPKSQVRNKTIESTKLNAEFARVTEIFALSSFIKKTPTASDIIIIDSDDENESDDTRNLARNSAGPSMHPIQSTRSCGGIEAPGPVSASRQKFK